MNELHQGLGAREAAFPRPASGGAVPRLAASEWRFDAVPAEERLACLLYEYARESPAIRGWWRRLHEHIHIHRGKVWEQPDGRRVELGGDARLVLAEVNRFQPRPPRPMRQPEFAGLLCRAGLVFGQPPWQALPPAVRRRLGESLQGERAIRRGSFAHLERIRQAARQSDWLALDGAEGALPPPSICDPPGCEATVLVIDWANFDDKQIGDDLRRWVSQNRPAGVPEVARKKAGKGKPADLTARLRALAALRLLGHYKTVEQLAARDQPAWKYFQGPRVEGVGKELRRAQNQCFRYFRELFPFETAAPASGLPQAWLAWRKSIPGECLDQSIRPD